MVASVTPKRWARLVALEAISARMACVVRAFLCRAIIMEALRFGKPERVGSNPSLKRSADGRTPGSVWRLHVDPPHLER
jgi:hypothetical protein